MSESAAYLQVLRSLDKADRMESGDVFDLLTNGRRDRSGDFTKGCGLTSAQALVLTGFVFSGKHPHIANRLHMIRAMEDAIIDDACTTVWDVLLDMYVKAPEPKKHRVVG